VSVGEPFGDFRSVTECVRELRQPTHEDVAQRLPFDELHHDHRGRAGLEQLVDLADVGMIERSGGKRLRAEA
jgi:hypothetical protein